MAIEAKKYDHLVGGLPGFSPKQIEQHIKLYEGYVKKINEIRAEIDKIPYEERKAQSNFSFGRYSELKRREAVPYNGVYLHEMYFDNLGGGAAEPKAELARAIEGSFGSQSNWEEDLRACAEAATGGWVLLTYDRIDGKLHHNQMWEHSIGIMVNQEHLLALDTWEHAFMIDFGTDKKSYLTTFLKNVRWGVVADRLALATRRARAA
jgi:Fe-Mn family superoxide dismutase